MKQLARQNFSSHLHVFRIFSTDGKNYVFKTENENNLTKIQDFHVFYQRTFEKFVEEQKLSFLLILVPISVCPWYRFSVRYHFDIGIYRYIGIPHMVSNHVRYWIFRYRYFSIRYRIRYRYISVYTDINLAKISSTFWSNWL